VHILEAITPFRRPEPTEHELVEEEVDLLHARVCLKLRLLVANRGGSLATACVRPSHGMLLRLAKLRPLELRDLRLEDEVYRLEHVAQCDWRHAVVGADGRVGPRRHFEAEPHDRRRRALRLRVELDRPLWDAFAGDGHLADPRIRGYLVELFVCDRGESPVFVSPLGVEARRGEVEVEVRVRVLAVEERMDDFLRRGWWRREGWSSLPRAGSTPWVDRCPLWHLLSERMPALMSHRRRA
jgi:hypothetical protein